MNTKVSSTVLETSHRSDPVAEFNPWMNKKELLWLYRFLPDCFKDWCKMEEAKLENDLKVHGEKKNGVWGKKTLDIILEEAIKEYGHMSDEELQEYKMSHGHCTQSKH